MCTLSLMVVKAPRERSLMPQYRLADRGTQRKHASMKWQTEGKRCSEKRCSALLTVKIRRESGWAGYIHRQLKSFKESQRFSFDVELECQTALEDNVLLKEEAQPQENEQHNWHCQRKTADIWLIWSRWNWVEMRGKKNRRRICL